MHLCASLKWKELMWTWENVTCSHKTYEWLSINYVITYIWAQEQVGKWVTRCTKNADCELSLLQSKSGNDYKVHKKNCETGWSFIFGIALIMKLLLWLHDTLIINIINFLGSLCLKWLCKKTKQKKIWFIIIIKSGFFWGFCLVYR